MGMDGGGGTGSSRVPRAAGSVPAGIAGISQGLSWDVVKLGGETLLRIRGERGELGEELGAFP